MKEELEKRLKEELKRAERYSRVFSLVGVALDKWPTLRKKGELFREEALKKVIQFFKANCRSTDLIFVDGQGKLSLLLPETESSGAFTVAERLREKVVQKHFKVGQDNFSLTFSAGLASYPHHAGNLKSLTKRAEKALKMAKKFGNRVLSPPLKKG